MIEPAQHDLRAFAGDTFYVPFRWTDQLLAGGSGLLQVRSERPDDEVLLELSTENDGIVLSDDSPDGLFVLQADADATALWTWESAAFDLHLVLPSGDRVRPFEGRFHVEGSVSRTP